MTWDTIANFHAGDALTLFGFKSGVSSLSWDPKPSGSGTHLGATLRMDLAGDGTTAASVTFDAMSLSHTQAMTTVAGATSDGIPYLYVEG